jgi:hypothetical protein
MGVSQAVHEGVQVGRSAAAGTRRFDYRSGAGVGGESKRAAPVATGVPPALQPAILLRDVCGASQSDFRWERVRLIFPGDVDNQFDMMCGKWRTQPKRPRKAPR